MASRTDPAGMRKPFVENWTAPPDALEGRLRLEKFLADLSTIFVSLPARDVNDEIHRSLEHLTEVLGVQRAAVVQFSEDKTQLRVTQSHAVDGIREWPRLIKTDDFPWYARQLFRGEMVRVRRTEESPEEATLERQHWSLEGLKSHLTVPMVAGESILGAVAMCSFHDERIWSDDLVQRLRIVGEIFGAALVRKRTEEALSKSEERFRLLSESTNAIPWEADAKTWRFTYVGPQAPEVLGYSVAQWYEDGFWAAKIHPDDQLWAIDFCATSSQTCEQYDFEYRMIAADGRVVWLHDLVSVELVHGEPRTLRGFMIDITERKKAESRLQRSEARFRRLLEGAPDAILLVDRAGHIQFTNDQSERLFGYRREELTGITIEQLLPKRFRHRHTEHRACYLADPRTRRMGTGIELWGLRKDGREFPVEISLSPIETEDGQLVVCDVRDLTSAKRAEEAVRESEKQLRLIADSLPVIILYIDAEERYRFTNSAYGRWLGRTGDEVYGRTLKEVLPAETYEAIRKHVETVLSGQEVSFDSDARLGDGGRHRIHATYVPRVDDDGKVLGFYALVQDITDRVRAEEASRVHRAELAHVSRVATIGELSASLAHELNQPLSAIVSNAQAGRRLLARQPQDPSELNEALAEITDDAKRAGEVIRRLRAFLKKGDLERRSVDINKEIVDVASLVRSDTVAKNISMKFDLAPGLPAVEGDRIQLQQVVLNLLVNACEAMRSDYCASRELVVRTAANGADSVEVSIKDCGAGFDPETAARMFDAFFTTKDAGMGMGLSISRSIIEMHGGRLWATRNPDCGATFHFTVPTARV